MESIPGSAADPPPLLSLKGISKIFPNAQALRGIDLVVSKGEVHGLVGQTGSGKSTLVRILAGILPPDQGTIALNGSPVYFRSPVESRASGIGVLLQENLIVPSLSVAENILITHQPVSRFGLIDRKASHEQVQAILTELGMDHIDPGAPAGSLFVSDQRMVEIATVLALKPALLVLDDPTTLLPHQYIQLFLAAIRRHKSGTGIIYISPQLEEIFAVCDPITVLRYGEKVGTFPTATITRGELIVKMIGRDPVQDLKPRQHHDFSHIPPVLQVDHLSDDNLVHDASFSICPGEILTITGQVGAGRTDIAQVFFGISRQTSGKIHFRGEPLVIRKPADALSKGIGYQSVDRPSAISYQQLAITSRVLVEKSNPVWNMINNHPGLLQLATGIRDRFSLGKPAFLRTADHSNTSMHPKVILSTWMALKPAVLFIEEPTRGVDIGSQVEILSMLQTLAEDGCAVIILSTHVGEISLIADHIVTYRNGRLAKEFPGRVDN